MKQRILDVLSTFVLLSFLGLAAAMLMPRAYAGMIPAEQASESEMSDRARVKDLLARPEVVREMEKMGIPPEKAAARVDAMTDAEVTQLAGRLNALPAGGAVSNEQLLLVIIIVLLVVILI
jgi:hypothetical protein